MATGLMAADLLVIVEQLLPVIRATFWGGESAASVCDFCENYGEKEN
jgi:hypothetical protein